MDKLLTIDDVAQYFSVSKSTVRRWMAKGDFPRPDLTIGEGATNKTIRWYKKTIKKFMEEKR